MPDSVAEDLAAPFDLAEVKFKPQAVSGNRAMAVPYVDARLVAERLDEAVGLANWQDTYTVLPGGEVVCRLSVRLGGEWVAKEDVGGQSEQPDEGDRMKAAFSDALKRAAVKFGVGRYLYRLRPQWCDYDPAKRQFVRPPQLPADALPTPPLSDAQVKVLAGLIRESEADITAFCAYFGASELSEVPAARFAEAAELLRRKVAKKEGKA